MTAFVLNALLESGMDYMVWIIYYKSFCFLLYYFFQSGIFCVFEFLVELVNALIMSEKYCPSLYFNKLLSF